jgi:glycosyltransferase involved in cell wall biosynthesis
MKLVIAQPYITLKGGMERVVLKIAQHYDAKIYTMEYNPETTFPEFMDIDIEIIGKAVPLADRLPYRASQGLRYGYNFYNLKIHEDYDVINSHTSPSEWIRHENKRVLWYCHTPPREVYDLYAERMKNRSYGQKFIYASFTSAYKFITKGIIKEVEEIATNSVNTQNRIKEYFDRESTVINPGIDCKDFANKGNGKFFLCSSRIVSNKRQNYVINAFLKFKKKTKLRYRLIIAGTLSKDKEHQDYYSKLLTMKDKDLVFKINIDDKELKELYAACTAVVLASINEDFGIVPLEGMASSKPVIAVNEGGYRETIVDSKTGFLVNSVDEMAEKMLTIVEHPKTAEAMGKAGKKRVEKYFSWNMFFKKFDALAKKVADSKQISKK